MRRYAARFARLAALLACAGVAAGCDTLPDATPAQAAAWQGSYAGNAVLNDAALPGQVCVPHMAISGFAVTGNQVQFGELGEINGTIRADGSLEMNFRGLWIRGRFVPDAFFGQMLVPPVEFCVYRMVLNRLP